MISAIKKFFEQNILLPEDGASADDAHSLKVAAVSLLLDMASADYKVEDEELVAVANSARQLFGLTETETAEIVTMAEHARNDATCYFEFTRLINDSFDPQQKIKLVETLWEVAYSDKHLEKYEEAMVRKISELIYVGHADFIAAKHRVKQKLNLE